MSTSSPGREVTAIVRRSLAPNLVPIALLLSISLFYLTYSYVVTSNIFSSSGYGYFNLLIDALAHGRLDVQPLAQSHDLSLFHGKWYLYWGPSPALFVLPFTVLLGIGASDVFYTGLAGIINVVLFYFVTREFLSYTGARLSLSSQMVILVSFAICSPHLWLSLSGGAWESSQIIATSYVLLFLLFLLKFLNGGYRLRWLTASACCYCSAWFARFSLVFYGILLLYAFLKVMRLNDKVLTWKTLRAISMVVVVFVGIWLAYNYARFGNPLDSGLAHVAGAPRYTEAQQKYGIFSLTYVPHNVSYYFLNHLPVYLEEPFVGINPEGNSVVSVYPTILFCFAIARSKLAREKQARAFLLASLAVIATIWGVLMCFFGTGWVQFGSRYSLDVLPLLYLMTLLGMDCISGPVKWSVLGYGMLVNVVGTYVFYSRIMGF